MLDGDSWNCLAVSGPSSKHPERMVRDFGQELSDGDEVDLRHLAKARSGYVVKAGMDQTNGRNVTRRQSTTQAQFRSVSPRPRPRADHKRMSESKQGMS